MDFAPFRFFFFNEKSSHAPSFLLFRLTCLRALSECALAGAEKQKPFLQSALCSVFLCRKHSLISLAPPFSHGFFRVAVRGALSGAKKPNLFSMCGKF
jgi:hypothetical protein